MTNRTTIYQVLEHAILKEKESQGLYLELADRVNEPAAREAFADLARQEKGHQHRLEQYLSGNRSANVISVDTPVDYKIAEQTDQPVMTAEMKLKDVFLLAANREKAAHQLYTAIAAIYPEGSIKQLLLDLAKQELIHKERVEFLYTQVAFPQTDGG